MTPYVFGQGLDEDYRVFIDLLTVTPVIPQCRHIIGASLRDEGGWVATSAALDTIMASEDRIEGRTCNGYLVELQIVTGEPSA